MGDFHRPTYENPVCVVLETPYALATPCPLSTLTLPTTPDRALTGDGGVCRAAGGWNCNSEKMESSRKVLRSPAPGTSPRAASRRSLTPARASCQKRYFGQFLKICGVWSDGHFGKILFIIRATCTHGLTARALSNELEALMLAAAAGNVVAHRPNLYR